MDIVQEIDRRGALKRVALYLAGTALAGQAGAQTLIEGTEDTGRGAERFFSRRPETPATQINQGAATASEPTASMDWRRQLLSGERSIVLRRGGAAERVRYCTATGSLDRDGYARACYLLRDVRANLLYPISPSLLDALCGIQRWGEYHGRSSIVNVLSGYRSPATNDLTEGAARNSMHLRGRAADVHFEGFSTRLLAAMAKIFNDDGGTGIYLDMNMVHVDRGAPRAWQGSRPRRG